MADHDLTVTETAQLNVFDLHLQGPNISGHATATIMIETINLGSAGPGQPEQRKTQTVVEVHLPAKARYADTQASEFTAAGTSCAGLVILEVIPNAEGSPKVVAQGDSIRNAIDGKKAPARVRSAIETALTDAVRTLATPKRIAATLLQQAEADAAWAASRLERAVADLERAEAARDAARAAYETAEN